MVFPGPGPPGSPAPLVGPGTPGVPTAGLDVDGETPAVPLGAEPGALPAALPAEEPPAPPPAPPCASTGLEMTDTRSAMAKIRVVMCHLFDPNVLGGE